MEDTLFGLPKNVAYACIGVAVVVLVVLIWYFFIRADDKDAEKETMSDSDRMMMKRMLKANLESDPRNSMSAVRREPMVDPVLVAAALR